MKHEIKTKKSSQKVAEFLEKNDLAVWIKKGDSIARTLKNLSKNFKKVLDKVEGFGYNRKAAVDAAGEPWKLNNKDENVQRQSTISGKRLLLIVWKL